MKLSARITSAKFTQHFLNVCGYAIVLFAVAMILFGIFGSVHTLVTSDAGVNGMKLGMAIGALFYGLIALFLGCIGIVTAELLESKL